MQPSDPRRFSTTERDVWLSLVAVLFRLPGVLDARLQREAGLTHFEYLVLAALADSPNRALRMSDLATMVNGSLSRLSHVVQRLEKRGWVRRTPCPTDGRYTNATLTDDGYAKVAGCSAGYVSTVRHLVLNGIGAERQAQLHQITGEILRRLDQAPS